MYPWLFHVRDGCVPLFIEEACSFILLRQMIKENARFFIVHDQRDVFLRSV